jgi:choline dehydrogenase-like flavoprotein
VNKQVKGVECAWEHNQYAKGRVYAKKEVIISCGDINSPQLLILSGAGHKSTLE